MAMIELIVATGSAAALFAWLSMYNRKMKFMNANLLSEDQKHTQDAIAFAFLLLALLFVGFSLAIARTSIDINEAYYGALTGMAQAKKLLGTALMMLSVLWAFLFFIFIIRFILGYILYWRDILFVSSSSRRRR